MITLNPLAQGDLLLHGCPLPSAGNLFPDGGKGIHH